MKPDKEIGCHIFKIDIFSKFFGDLTSHIIREYADKEMKLFLNVSSIKIMDILLSLFMVFTLYIAEVMNNHNYVPKMPNQTNQELIFDTSYSNVQPYLFKISHATSMPTSPSMGTAVRRLIRDTLTFS